MSPPVPALADRTAGRRIRAEFDLQQLPIDGVLRDESGVRQCLSGGVGGRLVCPTELKHRPDCDGQQQERGSERQGTVQASQQGHPGYQSG